MHHACMLAGCKAVQSTVVAHAKVGKWRKWQYLSNP